MQSVSKRDRENVCQAHGQNLNDFKVCQNRKGEPFHRN